MNRRSYRLLSVCLVLCVWSLATVALAGADIVGPANYLAAGDGSFLFDVTLVADADGVAVEGWGLAGGVNTTVGAFDAKGLCSEPLASGETIVVEVEGVLDDPGQPGTTQVSFHLCSGDTLSLTTAILPSTQAVPAASTWGMIAMALMLTGLGTLVFRRLH